MAVRKNEAFSAERSYCPLLLRPTHIRQPSRAITPAGSNRSGARSKAVAEIKHPPPPPPDEELLALMVTAAAADLTLSSLEESTAVSA
jgi:hypothetical protein